MDLQNFLTWHSWNFATFGHCSPCPHPLAPNDHCRSHCLSEFDCFRFHTPLRSSCVYLSVSGLLHLAQCPPIPSVLQTAGWPSSKAVLFLVWHFLLAFVDEHFGVSMPWLLWVMPLFTILISPRGKCSEVELLDHIVVLFSIFWGTSVLVFLMVIIIDAPP